jgi:hypothetical protein
LDDLSFDAGPTIFDLLYTNGANTIHSLWSLSGSPSIDLATASPSATVRDWHNQTSTVNASNGRVTISTNQHPVFVTFDPLAPVNCTPRPAVSVTTARGAPGTLVATVRVSGANNVLTSIILNAQPNTLVDVDGQTGLTGIITVSIPAGSTSKQFAIRRASASGSATVNLDINDRCPGVWKSLAGGGPDAFR